MDSVANLMNEEFISRYGIFMTAVDYEEIPKKILCKFFFGRECLREDCIFLHYLPFVKCDPDPESPNDNKEMYYCPLTRHYVQRNLNVGNNQMICNELIPNELIANNSKQTEEEEEEPEEEDQPKSSND